MLNRLLWRHRQEIHEWNNRLTDFSDTAHLLSQLDLVITVDTAVAHLAAALNKPTQRFLKTPTSDGCANGRTLLGIPPCVFRQKTHGDWQSVAISWMKHLTPCFSLIPRL